MVVKILYLGIYTKSMHQIGFDKNVEFLNVVLLEMGIVYKQKKSRLFLRDLWSWAESNRRPNK